MTRLAGDAAPKGGRLISIICTLAAPLVLYLIVRAAAGHVAPAIAVSMPPANHAPLARQLSSVAAKAESRPDQQTLDLLRAGAISDPLSAAPLAIAARAAEVGRNPRLALALMEEARRRRPRWLLVRLQLVTLYGRMNRHREFLNEVSYALSVNEQSRFLLLPELVRQLQYAEARRHLALLLAGNPVWKRDFFNVARGASVNPDHALDLLRLVAARGGDVAEEERLYLTTLMAAGRFDLARARWLRSLPAAEQARSKFLYNGDFRSSAAAGEFGWTLSAIDLGRADIITAQGGQPHLAVQYYGGNTAILAQQMIALAPGRYRLQTVSRGTSAPQPGRLVWTIACASGTPELARLVADVSSPQDKTVSTSFAVPPGACSGQMLRLAGEPGDVAAATEAQFSKIEISDAR